jgi:hypothetical protein
MRKAFKMQKYALTTVLGSRIVLLAVPLIARADYVATGSIRGNVCWGFIIESCSFHPIDAVEGEDGRLYTMRTRYKTVSEYDEKMGRCWIRTKSTSGGFWPWATNAAF